MRFPNTWRCEVCRDYVTASDGLLVYTSNRPDPKHPERYREGYEKFKIVHRGACDVAIERRLVTRNTRYLSVGLRDLVNAPGIPHILNLLAVHDREPFDVRLATTDAGLADW